MRRDRAAPRRLAVEGAAFQSLPLVSLCLAQAFRRLLPQADRTKSLLPHHPTLLELPYHIRRPLGAYGTLACARHHHENRSTPRLHCLGLIDLDPQLAPKRR
jgi:hypothetical protein